MTSALPRPQVTPSLTLSMPRYESEQESESDSPEPVFHLEKPAMPVSSVPARNSPKTPRSLFKEIIDTDRQRERGSDSDDPFQFTAQDAAPEPPKKRVKRRKEQDTNLETAAEKGGQAKERSSNEGSSSPRARRKRGLGEGDEKRTLKSPSRKVPRKEREDRDAGKDLEVTVEKGNGNSPPGQGKKKRGLEKCGEERAIPESPSKRVRGKGREDEDIEGFPELQMQRYRRITHRKTIKTVTTKVQHVVTIEMINPSSGDLVESLTYEEDEEPEVQLEEKLSTDEEEEIITSFNQQASLGPQVFRPLGPGVSPTRHTRASTRKSRRPQSSSETDEKGSSKEISGKKSPNVTTERIPPLLDVESRGTGSPPLCTNTRVLAKWLDTYYYPGIVLSGPTKSGFYHVMFDDGDKRRIRRENLLVKDKLPVGQQVLVQGEDDCYSPGRIVGHYREMNNSGYSVERDDHVIKRYPQRKVI